MTKAELVEKVAAQINLTKKQTELVVNTVFQSITESLSQGKKVELRGFGSFRVRERNARVGRNPKSGDKVNVPAKKVPFFKAGKELRELVDNWAFAGPSIKSKVSLLFEADIPFSKAGDFPAFFVCMLIIRKQY